MQGTDRMNTLTNIVFVLADIMEANLMNMENEFKQNGFMLRHEAKRNFNSALGSIRKLRREVNHCSAATQENYGNDADMLNALILTIIDRCGDDDMFHFKLYKRVERRTRRLLTHTRPQVFPFKREAYRKSKHL